MYLGNFPSEFDQGTLGKAANNGADLKKAMNPDEGKVIYYVIGYLVAFVVLAFLGALYQFR